MISSLLFWYRLACFWWISSVTVYGMISPSIFGPALIKSWPFYFTDLSVAFTIIYFGTSSLSSLPLLSTIAYEIAFSCECIVIPVFWSQLYKTSDYYLHPTCGKILYNLTVHAIAGISLFIDFPFNNNDNNYIRFATNDVFYVLAFSIIYMCINRWYTLHYAPVYPILTWNSLSSYITAFTFCILTMITFFIGHYLKMYL